MKKTTVQVKFPPQFAKFIGNHRQIEFEGDCMGDFINHLETTFGNIKERLFEEDNRVRPYINIFIGKKNIASLEGLKSHVPEGESISLLLSRAGG
ncbi:MAG: hypothetical protein AAFP19_03780 [Bacteroidota bacterium]